MYELVVKRAHRTYGWLGENGKEWEDETETFDNSFDAVSALMYAIQDYPDHKITFKFRPNNKEEGN